MLSTKREQPKLIVPPTQPTVQSPFVWVTFFEENTKFGIAYLLNSNSVGMKYNDSTCIIANNNFQKMKYLDFLSKNMEDKNYEQFEVDDVPERLSKKVKIISYYQKELKNKK